MSERSRQVFVVPVWLFNESDRSSGDVGINVPLIAVGMGWIVRFPNVRIVLEQEGHSVNRVTLGTEVTVQYVTRGHGIPPIP